MFFNALKTAGGQSASSSGEIPPLSSLMLATIVRAASRERGAILVVVGKFDMALSAVEKRRFRMMNHRNEEKQITAGTTFHHIKCDCAAESSEYQHKGSWWRKR